jgi:Cu+-exporting ATPase
MHCASCVGRVEEALKAVPGVAEASVNLLTHEASVTFTETPDLDAAVEAVTRAGYQAAPLEELAPAQAAEEAELRYEEEMSAAARRARHAWGLTAPLLVLMFLHSVFDITVPGTSALEILIAFAALFLPGRPVFVSAFKSIRAKAPNMDALIALGAGAAALSAPLGTPGHAPHVRRDDGAAAARVSPYRALSRGARAWPRLACNPQAHGARREDRPRAARRRGDGNPRAGRPARRYLRRAPGERLPADGEVISGESAVDESLATGEPMPVDKRPGDTVLGGTINTSGALHIRATRVGQDSFLAQIARLVREAQAGKPPIQVLADRITMYFVPAILLVALFTFGLWLIFPQNMQQIGHWAAAYLPWHATHESSTFLTALNVAIAVLVVSCPCALGLATPTAVLVGTGWAAQRGILFRDASALQALRDATIFCFDKTGTLTHGTPKVTDIQPVDGVDKRDLLRIAASLEHYSEHPLARAIVAEAHRQRVAHGAVEDFAADAGAGARGLLDGLEVLAGKPSYMESRGISTKAYGQIIYEWSHQAKTSVLVAHGGRLLGAFALADTIKPESIRMIKVFDRLKLRTLVISGDRLEAARVVAQQVGIREVLADVLPEDKADKITRLRKETIGQVAMVGDGINDAGALAAAGVGIAMGAGSDVAVEAAGVTLVHGSLRALLNAYLLARATYHTIIQNFVWAVGYNVVAVPLAMSGLLHPVIAEICMALSSLAVVYNSLRLRKFNPDPVIADILQR